MGVKISFLQAAFMVFLTLFCSAKCALEVKLFNVEDYGAVASDTIDNSKAFLEAWKEACDWKGRARVLIPKKTFMINPISFQGPCKGLMTVINNGVLIAPKGPITDRWISFQYVDYLNVFGGVLHGQGSTAWQQNDCKNNHNCQQLATNMRFDFVNNGLVHHVHSVDSKSSHFVVYECKNMTFTKIRISAPEDSPNTDGIKISLSEGIQIRRSVIKTGDDCIAMISGTRNVVISEVMCGPGHGISIGSLGKHDGEQDVEDIVVKNCIFYGTSNGLRIKTWAAPLSQPLKVSNIFYDNIVMKHVWDPIVIDQQYCPFSSCSTQGSSQVEISNIRYKNIQGISNSEVAVTLDCSKDRPCHNIILDNIDLWPQPSQFDHLTTSCRNAKGVSYGKQNPPSCF